MALERYEGPEIIIISMVSETSTKEPGELIAGLSEHHGEIVRDSSRADVQGKKTPDCMRVRWILGHECRAGLQEGLDSAIHWFKKNWPGGTVLL